jgi:hypothetical protein
MNLKTHLSEMNWKRNLLFIYLFIIIIIILIENF